MINTLQQLQDVPIKGVVFDMDGVLVDTSPCHSKAYEQLWYSLSISGPKYKTIAGRSTKEVVAEYAPHLDLEQQKNAIVFKQLAALELLKTTDISFMDTVTALAKLSANKIPMVVATSASKASAELALENAGLATFFSHIITSEDVERSKPAPDLFLAAIDALGVPPAEVVIIEDSHSGILAALASGAYTVAVREADKLEKCIAEQARYIGYFDNVADVVEQVLA